MHGPLVVTEKLSKRFAQTQALEQVSLTVEAGSIFGLLGPNGSGKSTLLRLILGFLYPDEGRLRLGIKRQQIGYLPDRPSFPPRARLDEYLQMLAVLAGIERSQRQRHVRQRLEESGLGHAARWRIQTCSRGMVQRLGLAAAMLHDPALLILDEPLNGLDPAGQYAMRQQIQQLHRQGHTVLISTHRLNDIAPLCTHLAILHQGRLAQQGPQAELLPLLDRIVIRTAPLPTDIATHLLRHFPGLVIAENSIELAGENCPHKAAVLRILLEANVDVTELTQARTNAEDIYLAALQSTPRTGR